jgi:RNA polymerase sigma-70 factor (ECF subfamily)
MNQVAQQIEVHVPALMRYALALAHNPTAAQDLVQECVVVRALTKASFFKPDTNLRAWLFTILHNLYVSEIRRNKKWKEAANPEAAMNSLSVPPSQIHTVMLRAVREAMRRLPSQQKMILYLIGVEGRSYKEVSRELSIPIGTVKSRCSRARDTLQQELDSRTASFPDAA